MEAIIYSINSIATFVLIRNVFYALDELDIEFSVR